MDPSRWLSNEHRGVGLWLLRGGLWWAQWPYSWVVAARNRRFDRGRGVQRVDVPVISIGNLTTGGTGKTPAVAWLCRYLRGAGLRVATISRGYGAEDTGGRNDEAIELEQQLPDVPHLQNPDRVAAAEVAIEELASQCLVLDDGFQHRRLARDLNWVIIDARCPFGFGHLLPRGLLREPLGSLKRADAVLISRANQVSADELARLRERIARFLRPNVPVVACAHAPIAWVNSRGETHPIKDLRTDEAAWGPPPPWTGFCGIGNPAAFRQTLTELGCEPDAWRVFPDHHRYSREDLAELRSLHLEAVAGSGPRASVVDGSDDASRPTATDPKVSNSVHAPAAKGSLLCTVKDLVKIETERVGTTPLWALRIGLEFLDDPSPLLFQLAPLIQRAHEQQVEVWHSVDDLVGTEFDLGDAANSADPAASRDSTGDSSEPADDSP